MMSIYARKFWRKMKALTFSFGPKQALALLAAAGLVAVQVHYGLAKNSAARFLIIAAPYFALLIAYFSVLVWQTAKTLDRELSAELEAAISQSSEVFAELILAWLDERLELKTRFTLEQVAKETGLTESSALQGLMLLGNKYGIVRETLLSRFWEYSAVGPALRLKSRYRLRQESDAV